MFNFDKFGKQAGVGLKHFLNLKIMKQELIWTFDYLNSLKRPQLQKLCKDNGIKAAGKVRKFN